MESFEAPKSRWIVLCGRRFEVPEEGDPHVAFPHRVSRGSLAALAPPPDPAGPERIVAYDP
jgi:hypothetical protein